jgi:hypothetical protein
MSTLSYDPDPIDLRQQEKKAKAKENSKRSENKIK